MAMLNNTGIPSFSDKPISHMFVGQLHPHERVGLIPRICLYAYCFNHHVCCKKHIWPILILVYPHDIPIINHKLLLNPPLDPISEYIYIYNYIYSRIISYIYIYNTHYKI